jgi:ADP-ribose pyrophosphatase
MLADRASEIAPGLAARAGGAASTLSDRVIDVRINEPESVGTGFRPFERYHVELAQADGGKAHLVRDILRVGRTVGVIAIDLARDEIVVIRQFRLAAQLGTGVGELVEIPAGYVDTGETPIEAVKRECLEEIGVAPRAVREIYTFMPAPGILDEHATIYLAAVDAAQALAHAGAAYETEQTRPIRVRIDDALDALRKGTIHNGYLIIALQWIALNRDRLPDLLRDG